ncbi:MAG: GIY-YIG nuclease family protein [Candidatus Levybacteria bacterium]|nr:GIY-YIG nuclease family protein [Candidatus Levybacteria bacterium]
MYFVYLLKSHKDGSFYIGSTGSIEVRLDKHNKGYSKYTKSKRPWTLIHKKEYATISEARKREYYLKSLKSKIAIEKLITAPSSSG